MDQYGWGIVAMAALLAFVIAVDIATRFHLI